jgi:hypothetical protein
MKTYGGVEFIAPPFLTSTLDVAEWSASRPGEEASGTQRIGGWVDPSFGPEAVEKRKILHCRNRTWAVQPVARHPGVLRGLRFYVRNICFNTPHIITSYDNILMLLDRARPIKALRLVFHNNQAAFIASLL